VDRALNLARDSERARLDPAKQITLELDAQKQKLIDQFPLREQAISHAVEELKTEKLITLERTEQFKRQQTLLAAQSQGLSLQMQLAELARGWGEVGVDTRSIAVAQIEAQKAAQLNAATINNALTPALKAQIDKEAELRLKVVDATEAARKHAEQLTIETRAAVAGAQAESDLGDALAASARDRAALLQRQTDSLDVERQLGDLAADRIAIGGRQGDADRARLQNQIQYIQQLKTIEEAEGKDIRLRDAQILNAQAQLQSLDSITLDIGKHIGQTLSDVFTAMISGTLKGIDVAKVAAGTLGRIATDIFQQVITKKLSFETTLFSNLQSLPGQASSVVAAGAASLPGGSTGGGIFQSLFGGGGGSGGGFLSSILPSGSSFGGLLGAGVGGFGLSSLFGGTGLQNILSSVGSIGGSLLGGVGISGAGFGIGTIGDLLGSTVGEGMSGLLGGSLSGMLGGMVADFLLPGIGSLIGFLLGGLFSHPLDPTVWVKSKLEGILYDEMLNEFQPGSVKSRGTGKDISGATVTQVTSQVQQMLKAWSEQWADLLNIFPVFAHDKMIPALDDANKLLNQFFGKLKFSEGGSRTIQQEMDDLQKKFGPKGFFMSLRETIGIGLAENFRAAGLTSLIPAVQQQFPAFMAGQGSIWLQAISAKDTGLHTGPKGEEFTQALAKFAQFTTALATVSTHGVTPFLTAQDQALLEDKLGGVLKQRKGADFIAAVGKLDEQLSPVTEFLKKAVTESSEIFGRGLMAALDAVSESQAQMNFLQSIGEGAKQILFQGITEAFIASANFTDLMAPIQKIIREFTQQAIDTRTTPDLAAFRAAIFPAVEDISTRAALLAPLIAELQKLGFDLKDLLTGLFSGGGAGGNHIVINIGSVGNEQDARTIADLIFQHLDPALAPPS
jgi:hypothetical protein